jgi:RNA polymerase sigma-70 factor, ECF subfamily
MTNRAEQESRIRSAFDAGDMTEAARLTFDLYERDIRGFIRGNLRAQPDADEAFSTFAESFWKGLSGFGWRCSMRTWCYTLAHNVVLRCALARHRRRKHNLLLSSPDVYDVHDVYALSDQSQAADALYKCVDLDVRLERLRSELDRSAQALLTERLDRSMSFREVARARLGSHARDSTRLAREEVRLRKEYSRLTIQLRRMAEDRGLVP